MWLAKLLLLGIAHVSASQDAWTDSFDVFESIESVPHHWTAAGEPAAGETLQFKIALQAADPDALLRHLKESSDPQSQQYGVHLTASQLKSMTDPTQTAITSVISWLNSSGTQDIHSNAAWIYFRTTPKLAGSMLNTKFLTYHHTLRKDLEVVRTTRVELPRHILPYVKMVHPTTRFSRPREQNSDTISNIAEPQSLAQRRRNAIPACRGNMTPACLRKLYNMRPIDIPDPSNVGRLGVAGFLNEYVRFDDVDDFIEAEAPWAKGANVSWSSVHGGVMDQNYPGSSSEANLDVQYALTLSYPVRTTFYSTAGAGPLVVDLDQPNLADNQNEPFVELFQHLLAEEQPPHTLTISYGENEQSVPQSYAKTVCDMIAQLGARGTSVIISSGDTGPGSACQTNDGQKRSRFQPIFPAACPYATAVGGTSGIDPERAANFSSGGFSDIWPRPWYQEQAVIEYLNLIGDTWSGLYNPQGRGFPDVAAQATNFLLRDKNRLIRTSGTSASAPVLAAMVASFNAVLLQSGRPTLGFLNPWLYQTGARTMTDIIAGASQGCTGRSRFSNLLGSTVHGAGWKATKGWDAVTGMGTPNFELMLSALTAAHRQSSYPNPHSLL